jgi:hypothetical protein
MTLASMLVEAVPSLRERLAIRLLGEDQKRQYSEQRGAEADDELRAVARAELEAIMAIAMLSQLGLGN